MSRSVAALLVALLHFGVARTAQAQVAESFLYDDAHDNVLSGSFELDPAMAFGVGYIRAIDLHLRRFERRLGFRAKVTTILGGSSWDFVGGSRLFLAASEGFNVLAAADLELKLAQNEVHSALVYGYAGALRPGYYDPTWFASLALGLHGAFAGTLWHTDSYEGQFPEVADGTYRLDALALYAGGVAGFRIRSVVSVGLRFAWRFPRTFESYAPYFQPYTANLEVAWHF